MKTDIITTPIALRLPVPIFATTLRLSVNVNLLIFDGREVSSSLPRGVDGVELDNGPHQLVFRVEKTIHPFNSEEQFHISSPLVVSFNTQLINQVDPRLPCLENEREANYLSAAPHLKLLDDGATPTPVKLDILTITSIAKTVDCGVEVERYNKSVRRVSLPQFTTMMVGDSILLSSVSELDAIPPQSQVLTEQRLKYWLKLADPQTRNTFLQWTEKQSSS